MVENWSHSGRAEKKQQFTGTDRENVDKTNSVSVQQVRVKQEAVLLKGQSRKSNEL